MVLFLIPIVIFLLTNLIWIIPVCLTIVLVTTITKKTYRGIKGIFIKPDPDAPVQESESLSNSFGVKILKWFGGMSYGLIRKIVRKITRSSPALSDALDHGLDYAAEHGINNVTDVVDGAKSVAQTGIFGVLTSYAATKGIASEQARQGIKSATDKVNGLADKAQGSVKTLIENPKEASENIKNAAKGFSQNVKAFFSNIYHRIFDKPESDQDDSLPQSATSKISQGFTNTGNMISNAFDKTKNRVGNAAKKIENSIENTVNNTTELKSSVNAWKAIDWKNGEGILPAIQTTAEGCSSGFGLLKKLPGGKYLTGRDLRAATFVAAKFFPPAAIAMEAGRVVLNTGGRISDITEVTRKVYNNVMSRHYLKASYGAFELFRIIAFNSGAKKARVVH